MKINSLALFYIFLSLIFSPLLFGVINRIKAFFAGRCGQRLLQPYYDLYKLFRKDLVYSRSTTDFLKNFPFFGLALMICALLLLPQGKSSSLISFNGDLVLMLYFLGLYKFFLVLAALDTASAFEGMGASRELFFSSLAEPSFFIGLAVIAHQTSSLSLSTIFSLINFDLWLRSGAAFFLIALSFFVILLSENCRVPFDDPNTHLELTMIHEVMVLDYSGPDFALILYNSSLKLWIFASILWNLINPLKSDIFLINFLSTILGIFLVAILIGTIESILARFRLIHVAKMLIGAGILSIFAFTIILKG